MWINAEGKRFWVKYHFKSEQGVECLTRSDADADHSVAHVAFPQLGGQREDVTAAGGTERMPDRDSAPVPGEFVVGDNESVELVGQ